ncbi:MAG: hypothetical protein QM758_15880 [Armatimonas sp.]
MIPAPPPPPAPMEQRLILKANQLLCEEAVVDPATLVDEQMGVDAPKSVFFPGWENAWRYPIHVTIDLGAERKVTRLFFYIETGGGALAFSTGKPFAWSKEQTVPREGYQSWKEVKIDASTRYLRLTLPTPAAVPELLVYAGTGIATTGPKPKQKTPMKLPKSIVTMDQLIGTNAFIDDPIETITGVAGFVREYHSWSWDTENPDRQLRFQPSGAAGGNSWFFDDYYGKLKKAGVTVVPALQGNIAGKVFDSKPDPQQRTDYMFQFAARYGGKKRPDDALHLAPGQPRVSGLGLLKYIENGNELDKTWRGREGWFTPYELAELCAADKAAVELGDPTMKLALAGLAAMNIRYLDSMKHWADFRRGGRFPADVINLHHYCSDGVDQNFGKTGISPEAGELRRRLTEMVQWRDKNAAGCEVWLTEFGWDTDPRSPIHAPAIGSMDAQTVQAAWLLRSYLLLAAAGVDRAAMFMLRDVDSKGGGVFETCGLVTQKGEWKPKVSWFWVATLKNRLKGYSFAGDVPTRDKNVMALQFTSGKDEAIALWCPTSEDKTVANFALPVGMAKKADQVTFETGSTTGKTSPLSIASGKVRLTVTERPVLVFLKK